MFPDSPYRGMMDQPPQEPQQEPPQKDLHMELLTTQLTRGEQLKMQRLQQARSDVQEQVQSGMLAPHEGEAMHGNITAGLVPLMSRTSRAMALQQEASVTAAATGEAHRQVIEGQNRQYQAQHLPNQIA